ncbi:MAG TPA: hypothetical protein VFV98_16485 [Vicinamibacterales bacterium]|nr:hypothetical protein [Vicinamibacterales bacterium]
MRSGAVGVLVVGALVVIALWSEPVSIPKWAVIPFLVALFGAGVGLTVKRMRTERRLARTLWHALTRKNPNG